MTDEARKAPARGSKWGWGILLALSLLLAGNGAALYFISASPSTFEQDTGVTFEEVQAVFPSVAEQVVQEGQTLSVLLAVLGLMAAVASLAGLRRRSRWAWAITGILLAMLVYFSVQFLVFRGRPDIGGFYLVLALLALAGQVLSGRSLDA